MNLAFNQSGQTFQMAPLFFNLQTQILLSAFVVCASTSFSQNNQSRIHLSRTPLLVVNQRRLSEYTPSFYGFFDSTGDVTEAIEKAEPAFSKTSVSSSNKSEESPFKSGESALSLASSNKSEEIKLPEIEYSHYKGEGVVRPKSRLGRPEG